MIRLHTCTRDVSQNHKDTPKTHTWKKEWENPYPHGPNHWLSRRHLGPRDTGQCPQTGCQLREMHPGSEWTEAGQGRHSTPLRTDGRTAEQEPSSPSPTASPRWPGTRPALHPAATASSEAGLHRALEHTRELEGRRPAPRPRRPEAPAYAGPDPTARAPPRVPAYAAPPTQGPPLDRPALPTPPALSFTSLCMTPACAHLLLPPHEASATSPRLLGREPRRVRGAHAGPQHKR